MTTRPHPPSAASPARAHRGPAQRPAEQCILPLQRGRALCAFQARVFESRTGKQATDARRIMASAALPATPAEATEHEKVIRGATIPLCACWPGIRIRPSSTARETRP